MEEGWERICTSDCNQLYLKMMCLIDRCRRDIKMSGSGEREEDGADRPQSVKSERSKDHPPDFTPHTQYVFHTTLCNMNHPPLTSSMENPS